VIKKHITLAEAEQLFPSSTIEWEVIGGNDRTEAYEAAARLGAPMVRWNVLRDVLCLGFFERKTLARPPGSMREVFHEIAYWSVDVRGWPLVGGYRNATIQSRRSNPNPPPGRWTFNDPLIVWAQDRWWHSAMMN